MPGFPGADFAPKGDRTMKATGIVRKIDELGRVVIPKEVRRTLKIRDGEPLEIFTDDAGRIILKKYSTISTLKDLALAAARALNSTTGRAVVITDRDRVVAQAGLDADLVDQETGPAVERCLREMRALRAAPDERLVTTKAADDWIDYYVAPMYDGNSMHGTMALVRGRGEDELTGEEEAATRSAAAVLAGMLEAG